MKKKERTLLTPEESRSYATIKNTIKSEIIVIIQENIEELLIIIAI